MCCARSLPLMCSRNVDELMKLICLLEWAYQPNFHMQLTTEIIKARFKSFHFDDVRRNSRFTTFIQRIMGNAEKCELELIFYLHVSDVRSRFILILFWYVDGVTGLTFYGSAVSAGNRNITLIRRRFECKRDSLLNVIDKSAKCHAGVVSEDVPEVESENWIV